MRGEAGMLAPKSVKHLRDELGELARKRQIVISEVTEKGVAYAVGAARSCADAVVAQHEERLRLEAVVERSYDDAFADLEGELDRGTLIRTEVVERWSERVGTGEVARWIRGSASWMRSALDRLSGQPIAAVEALEREARRELTGAVGSRLDRAARAVATGWEVDPAGRDMLTPDLRRSDADALVDIEATIDSWLAGLTRMVEEEAPGRFRAARVASTGVNAAAVGTILALFASTGGITGAEVGVAAGAAAAQQGILEHLLGRAAAGSLAGSARDGLLESIQSVFRAEVQRFVRVLAAATDPLSRAEVIREAADVVERESEAFHGR